MKIYKLVVDGVEKYRYKKGINRVDTSTGFYKIPKALYIVSFVWLAIPLLLYILSCLIGMSAYPLADNARELLISESVCLPLVAFGFFCLMKRWNISALAFSIAPSVALMVALYRNENVSVGFLNDGMGTKYFWLHFAPAILLIIFVLFAGIVGLKTKFDFKKDYNNVLDSMYKRFKEENPNATDAEWTTHLEKGESEE